MIHYLKTSMIISLLTIIFTGLFSFEVILPSHTIAIVDAQDFERQPLEENLLEREVAKPFPEEKISTEEGPIVIDENAKVAYLTFDDGPSPNVTSDILDILEAYDIPATFFVIGNLAEKHPDIILRMWQEGHLIGNHTYTHDYRHIYSNPHNFMRELEKTDELLSSILGVDHYKSKFIRFPGGSFGEKLKPFRQTVEEANYINVDWNVVSGDAEGSNVSPQEQLHRLQETLQNKKQAIVLMHDSGTKQTTSDALPDIIEYLIAQDYIFKTLEDARL